MMKETPYRILALDLDGTLTNSAKEITPRTREAIHRAIRGGIAVALASGRPYLGVAPVARALGLDTLGGYILCFNGGLVQRFDTGEDVFHRFLPPDSIKKICALAAGLHVYPLSYDQTGVVSPFPENRYVKREAYNNDLSIRYVPDLAGFIDYPVEKLMLVGEPEDTAKAVPMLQAAFGETLGVFGSEPYFIELVPPGINKASSLQILLDHLGLRRESLIACGDAMNDYEMLRLAGLSVAMENAVPRIKEAADFVTLSNDADGVAHVIETFLDV